MSTILFTPRASSRPTTALGAMRPRRSRAASLGSADTPKLADRNGTRRIPRM
jgi:hypothetical protein